MQETLTSTQTRPVNNPLCHVLYIRNLPTILVSRSDHYLCDRFMLYFSIDSTAPDLARFFLFSGKGEIITDEQLEKLYVQVNQFALVRVIIIIL
jgi:RNA recognition motif-containing protein